MLDTVIKGWQQATCTNVITLTIMHQVDLISHNHLQSAIEELVIIIAV